MSSIRRLAKIIRHAPLLERAEFLWELLRKPYHHLLNMNGNGVAIPFGAALIVHMPAEYSGTSWESYEVLPIETMINWLKESPTAMVLDLGCAVGIYSLIGLSVSTQIEVIACDPNLSNLKATQQMCRYTGSNRLRLLRGFISNENWSDKRLDEAIVETQLALLAHSSKDDKFPPTYLYLNHNTDHLIPEFSLDGLLSGSSLLNRPILLKCDVEGAELLVLQGFKNLLKNISPLLLLSVHPIALANYGHAVSQVDDFLQNMGYSIRVLSKDHEEHWWCEKHPRIQ